MAGWRRPGPLCAGGQQDVIADGTLCLQLSPKPGAVGASKSPQPATGTRSTYRPGADQVSLPLLRQQDHGDDVKKLQSFLNFRLDLRPPLRVDGSFGSVTRKAVVDFQTSRLIKADGEVGKTTWYHLIAGTAGKPLPTNVPVPQSGMAGGGPPASKPSFPPWLPPPDSVMDWPLLKKLEYVVGKVPGNLPTQLRTQVAGLVHAQSMVIKLEAMAYSELFGLGREAGLPTIATPGGQAIFELAHPTQITALAATQAELDKAAAFLAERIQKIGVAELLGELAKCELVEGGGASTNASGASTQSAADDTPLAKPESSGPPPPPPEESVFQSDIDDAAMAAVMQSAAQSGAPFCLE